jgi:hypothetical protein
LKFSVVAPGEKLESNTAPRLARHLPWLFLIAGSLLRVCWPLDMEWKFDEKWMWNEAERIARGEVPWPTLGMPSGVGLENPGLSIWPFAALAYVARSPIAMTEAVQWLNVVALWGFALWTLRCWPEEERALGLWGVALFAVSPLPVLFSRKIWAQDLLVLFVLPWLWTHSRRERRWYAFGFGLFGALLGQVHMSGFFAAASLLIAGLYFEPRRLRLIPWLLGSALGALLLVPWLHMLLGPHPPAATSGSFSLRFFSEGVRNAFGLGLAYPLGAKYSAFLAGPHLGGIATHLNALARYGLFALLVGGVLLRVFSRPRALGGSPALRGYMTALVLGGLALCAARIQIHAHYLIAWSPLLHVAAVCLLWRRRAAVIGLCVLQLYLSASFIGYVHDHGGVSGADYGRAYRVQSDLERSLP